MPLLNCAEPSSTTLSLPPTRTLTKSRYFARWANDLKYFLISVRSEDSSATFVNEVDHVGITESGQAEQKGHVILLNDPLDEALPAPVVRVILVHEKTTVEIDEEDGILEIIRDTHNLDSV